MAIFQGNAISSASGDFDIPYSCRFNDDDNAYLNRTPGSSGNRKTWTVSFWMKRGNQQANVPNYDYVMFGIGTDDGRICFSNDDGGDCLRFTQNTNPSFEVITKRKLRDHSAWYHIVIAVDTTQPTPADRIRVHVNGDSQETNFVSGKETYPSQHDDLTWNHTVEHGVGRTSQYSNRLYDGYLAEIHWVDGTALYPDSFGERGDYGEWKPKRVSGLTYGTTGFYLDFSNGAALGDDAAGSNDFTVNNITASDQMTDTPTNNFCTMNLLDNKWQGSTFSEGNLKVLTGGSGVEPTVTSTFGVNSGKWYFEVLHQAETGSGSNGLIGITGQLSAAANDELGQFADSYGFYQNAGSGNLHENNGYTSYGTLIGYTTGDIISVAFDLDNNKCYWAINGTWVNSGDPTNPGGGTGHPIIAPTSGHYYPAVGDYGATTATTVSNFGQDGTFAGEKTAQDNADDNGYGNFYYDVPAGFLALCTKNLPDPTVTPSEHFNTILYNGAGAKTGVGFQPDLVWVKSRGSTYSHKLTDAVRGVTKAILKPNSAVEATDSTGLTAFGADGFTVGADTTYSDTTGDGMVAWNWKANGSGSSNGTGSVTSTVSANTSAGFSIVSWVGTGATATIGHGLSQTPNFITVKNREGTHNQIAGTIQSNIVDFTDGIFPDWIDAMNDNADYFSDTPPTSSVFTVGSSVNLNQSTDNMIAYCWHSVEGYSKIGYYIGNGNADGPFIYTGFTPAWFFIKQITVAGQWRVYDNKRGNVAGANPNDRCLYFDSTAAEFSDHNYDLLSNGIKVRHTGGQGNTSGRSYLYMAFAEDPFKYTNAR